MHLYIYISARPSCSHPISLSLLSSLSLSSHLSLSLSLSLRYVKFFGNIRLIQNYLVKRADQLLIPKIDNTNIDRSLSLSSGTVFNCLKVYVSLSLIYLSHANQYDISFSLF